MSHFNVSLTVWAKSQDSVHKPQFLKRRERRADADRTEVLLLTSLAPYRWATPAHSLASGACSTFKPGAGSHAPCTHCKVLWLESLPVCKAKSC